jgi:hypothetical protein
MNKFLVLIVALSVVVIIGGIYFFRAKTFQKQITYEQAIMILEDYLKSNQIPYQVFYDQTKEYKFGWVFHIRRGTEEDPPVPGYGPIAIFGDGRLEEIGSWPYAIDEFVKQHN